MSAPRTVMVVDDDEALRESVCELLEDDGFRTVYAESGAAALTKLRASSDKPDVILLDLMMPVMNGWQFRKEQLRDPSLAAIPVVVMTASRDLQGIEADEVVYKPLTLKKLLEVVKRNIARPQTSGAGPERIDEANVQIAARLASPIRSSTTTANATIIGKGEVATRLRAYDWSQSQLGPIETWPPSLVTMLRVMLSSRYSMWLGWGPDLQFFYNDAYVDTLAAKHPWALGRPAREVWAEIWNELGPRIEHVLATGEATWDAGLLLFLERNGYPEETYHTFSYSPAPSESGGIAGLFCVVIEETDRVIGERRIKLLGDFAARLAAVKSVDEVLRALERTIIEDAREFPFALTYTFENDESRARLVARATIEDAHPAARDVVDLDDSTAWPFRVALETGKPQIIELPDDVSGWPTGAWRRPPTHAIMLPIGQQAHARPGGVFIAGLNPHRPIDDGAKSFVTLFVGQLSAGLLSAHAYEQEKQRAEALAEIDRAKTTFFSNVSHEFRTPLTLMLGPTDDLLSGIHGTLEGEQRTQLELLHRNGLRLQKLVNALLDFSRLEAGRVPASYEPVDLSSVTRELASVFPEFENGP